MQTIRLLEKTGKDGTLLLRVPLGSPNVEYEIVVIAQAKDIPDESRDWPPGYFDLAGSIDDDTFVRPPQGELPRPVDTE